MVELLVDAHELLDGVDVHAGVLRVHAYALLGADDAGGLGHGDDADQVPHHFVEHHLLVALVREEVLADLDALHVDAQLLLERRANLRHELIQVHTVSVVLHKAHDVVEFWNIAARVRAQRNMDTCSEAGPAPRSCLTTVK